MKLDITTLDKNIRDNLYNPQNIFKHSLEAFSDASNGEMVPTTATTPFANLLMYIATQSAISNDQIERASRRLLPEYANTIKELSPHFNYRELQLVHATPSTIDVVLQPTLSEVRENSILSPDGSRYMIIPKESVFTYLDGTVFGMHHDIMIRILETDSLDIYYLDGNTPLQQIEASFIKHEILKRSLGADDVAEILSIRFPVYNFSSRTEYRSVTSSTGFSEVFDLTDQLYHIRIKTVVDNTSVELLTAHGDFKYDPNSKVPIAVINYLVDNRVHISIPDVFIDKGLVGSEISINILETKGDLDIAMSKDGIYNITPTFKNGNIAISEGVNALRKVINLGAYSDNDPVGGTNTPTLDELRERVLVGLNDKDALTETQLRTMLSEIGYTLGHDLNYIGNNVFTASTPIDDYRTGDINTLVSTSNVYMDMSWSDDMYGIIKPTADKVVVTPNALISTVGANPKFLDGDAIDALNGADDIVKLSEANSGNLMSPMFHYLIDSSNITPEHVAFDLDNPTVDKPNYIRSNLNNVVKMATSDIYVNRTGGAYHIYIVTSGNGMATSLKDNDLIIQVGFDAGYGSMHTVNAEFVSRDNEGNFLFKAVLKTNFNLTVNGEIEIINTFNDINKSYYLPLTTKMFINYVVVGKLYVSRDVSSEEYVNSGPLPPEFSVITVEDTELSVGNKLSGLFTPIKSLKMESSYKTHTEDVIALYPEDVYEMDGNVRKVTPNPDYDPDSPIGESNSPILFNKLFSKGDKIVLDNGEFEYVARAGDVVYMNDMPVPSGDAHISHNVILPCLDYKFTLLGYSNTVRNEVVRNMDRDIQPIAELMIQDTDLQYTVGDTTGTMEITVDGSSNTTISNEITMVISVKVTSSKYSDGVIRAGITSLIKNAVANHINGRRYYENGLVDEINAVIKSSVISFKITSICGNTDMQSFNLVNPHDTMGIKSILSISDTGEYEIVDGIEVNYVSL